MKSSKVSTSKNMKPANKRNYVGWYNELTKYKLVVCWKGGFRYINLYTTRRKKGKTKINMARNKILIAERAML